MMDGLFVTHTSHMNGCGGVNMASSHGSSQLLFIEKGFIFTLFVHSYHPTWLTIDDDDDMIWYFDNHGLSFRKKQSF